jgi:hypothetical protein
MALESNTVECMLLRMLSNSLPPHVHESKLVLLHFLVSPVHLILSTVEVSVCVIGIKLYEVFPHCAILTPLPTKCHFSFTSDKGEFFGGEKTGSYDPYIHANLHRISNDVV